MDLQGKQEEKDKKLWKKAILKKRNDKRYPLILDLKQFGSLVKRNHSTCKEFESLSLRGKKLLA